MDALMLVVVLSLLSLAVRWLPYRFFGERFNGVTIVLGPTRLASPHSGAFSFFWFRILRPFPPLFRTQTSFVLTLDSSQQPPPSLLLLSPFIANRRPFFQPTQRSVALNASFFTRILTGLSLTLASLAPHLHLSLKSPLTLSKSLPVESTAL